MKPDLATRFVDSHVGAMIGPHPFVLSWRPAGSRADATFEWKIAADRHAAIDLAIEIEATAAARDGEFRLEAIGADLLPVGPAIHVDIAGLRRWTDDAPLPTGLAASPWREAIGDRGLRRRTAAIVRGALIEAWRGRALQREQVADLLGVVEQAFDRTGRASNRLPPV